MAEQQFEAGEVDKAEEVLDVVLPAGNESSEVVHPQIAVLPSSDCDSGAACVHPAFWLSAFRGVEQLARFHILVAVAHRPGSSRRRGRR